MSKHILTFIALALLCVSLPAQTTIKVFDEVLFYDGYNTLEKLADEMVPVPEGMIRHSTSVYATPLSSEQVALFGENITMHVTVKAACDNYDRLGHVNLALVPKGQTTYVPDETNTIELARFVTPFMDKNKEPDTVPYIFHVDYLKHIFKDTSLTEEYDFWLELDIFGVPYAANTQIRGCAGRSDTFYGSLEFVTSTPAMDEMDDTVLIPLFFKNAFNNYQEGATDIVGETIKSIDITLDEELSDSQLVLITSNHGAESGGEEYNRRWHYVYFNNEEVLAYKPGRETCEPFREYNTQGNGIYGSRPKTDAQWQSFSNWCPGDVIDTRLIRTNDLAAGTHNFRIEVPEALFRGEENKGDFPLSLYLLGKKEGGTLKVTDNKAFNYLTVTPDNTNTIFKINTNQEILSTEVFNIIGKSIYYSTSGNSSLVDLSAHTPGIYIIKVHTTNGKTYTHKIIRK